ncbi:ECF-type sigma factor [Rubrivirga sp.]|uniref:ECF-type sigma factor n=1 Tax=Rubrivirga sp. TaxID=1885344 RepID=UPI003C7557E0
MTDTLPAPAPPAAPAGWAPATDTDLDEDVAHLLDILGHRTDDPQQCARVYAQLRQIAHAHRVRSFGTPSVCTTALVHEAYLKLARSTMRFRSRAHFMMTSSRAMRQVLLTYAESRCAQKRGGGRRPVALDEATDMVMTRTDAAEIAGIGEALERLGRRDKRGVRVVECRFFGGLTVDETADTLGLSPATVTRSWRAARSWLFDELSVS